jgi:hypothetical protein
VGRKAKSGGSVLDMVIGAFVALVFLGLPLAIIGLFIASTLDRRHAKPPKGYTALRDPAPSAYATSQEGNKRRRIIYGGNSVAATAPVERNEPTRARAHGRKV